MAGRSRQTAHVCEIVELTEDAAVRAHRLILLSWRDDGRICDQEISSILAAASEVVDLASDGVTTAANVDAAIAAGLSLIHNGHSPRTERLLGELADNVVSVDFRADGPGPDDSGAALRAA